MLMSEVTQSGTNIAKILRVDEISEFSENTQTEGLHCGNYSI
jgi:hypothetical protein